MLTVLVSAQLGGQEMCLVASLRHFRSLEELELGTPERRSRTSAAIVAAVENFCAARARPPGVRAAVSGHRHDVNAAP